jgi:glutaredoxin
VEYASFTGLDAQVLGISVDHVPCLKAWAESLGGINYPLLSDFWPHGEVASRYGVFIEDEGKSERAIFVIDKLGIIRYIDVHDIDEQPSNDELRRVLREIDPEAAARETKKIKKEPETPQLPKGGIVLYCTPWCPACRRAKRWLKERDLEFTDVDITKTYGAAEQVMSWADGNRTTPTIDIDDTIIVDWKEGELAKVLKEKGYLP